MDFQGWKRPRGQVSQLVPVVSEGQPLLGHFWRRRTHPLLKIYKELERLWAISLTSWQKLHSSSTLLLYRTKFRPEITAGQIPLAPNNLIQLPKLACGCVCDVAVSRRLSPHGEVVVPPLQATRTRIQEARGHKGPVFTCHAQLPRAPFALSGK